MKSKTVLFILKELSSNRNLPLDTNSRPKLNLNGAVELIREDKPSANGTSIKKNENG